MPPYKSETTLRRGTACLSCRKRKLKCDGLRPVCRQCTKMNRGSSCEYDDKQQKSRTQLLKEQLSALERRLQELESNSSRGSSSPYDLDLESFENFDSDRVGLSSDYTLFNEVGSSRSSSSPSASTRQSTLFPSDETFSLKLDNGSASSLTAENLDPRHSLPYGAKKHLLDVFVAHRHQCWFYGNVERFLEQPQQYGGEPHPALINAMYLIACHFAQSSYYSDMEPGFFIQTQHEINTALDTSDRLPDIVQASCLIATYLYMNNRVMEGYRHTFSAMRLAVGLGLHQIRYSTLGSATRYPQQAPLIPISAPRDNVELTDRISAFWQVFMIDRCWSVANGLPLALPDKDNAHCRILTPWPSALESVKWESHRVYPPLQALFEGSEPVTHSELYMPALKAKAAALYELTFRSKNDPNGWSYRFAESAVQRFSSTIPSMTFDRDSIIVQTMLYTSFIHLRRVAFDRRAFKAGNSVIRLIRQLGDADYQYLDPIISACWFSAAEMFMRVLASAGNIENVHGDVINIINTCNASLGVLTNALKTLGTFSPLSGDLAMKLELVHAPTQIP